MRGKISAAADFTTSAAVGPFCSSQASSFPSLLLRLFEPIERSRVIEGTARFDSRRLIKRAMSDAPVGDHAQGNESIRTP